MKPIEIKAGTMLYKFVQKHTKDLKEWESNKPLADKYEALKKFVGDPETQAELALILAAVLTQIYVDTSTSLKPIKKGAKL